MSLGELFQWRLTVLFGDVIALQREPLGQFVANYWPLFPAAFFNAFFVTFEMVGARLQT